MTEPLCPSCGNEARASITRFGRRHDCCGLWSWDGAPLVDADTHEARKRAHEAFDEIWKGGLTTRAAAYKTLAEKLNIQHKDCHIKLMSADIASRVPEVARAIIANLSESAA